MTSGNRRSETRLRTAGMLGACLLAQAHVPGASFDDDLAFLKAHTDVVVLSDGAGKARVAVAPAWQGRVMTSTATGPGGISFGWINRALIESGQLQPHINVFGGEDRFWMGPEGGQFSIFFAEGVPFDLERWFTPAPLDTEAFKTVRADSRRAEFRHEFQLTNYSGTRFEVGAERIVELLEPAAAWQKLGVNPPAGLDLVAFESINRIRNMGERAWRPESGLLSIWILGMFNPSPTTTIVIPIKPGPISELGKPVNSDYFGPVPPERLVVKEGTVFFSGDGQYRSKLGVNPLRCKPLLGSYDSARKILTLVQFSFQPGVTNYVNSMWEIQKNPYAGDVANSYNDGPPAPGAKPLGPFYEMESSSPAAALAPGQSMEHVHRTLHLVGPDAALDQVARAALGVGVREIEQALH